MKNNSSQSRFQKITAKVIVMLLAVVLALSVLPALSADILPDASAAAEYVVTTTDITAINNAIANNASAEIDVKLNNDIGPGLTVPANKTVNLFLNGKRIKIIKSVVGGKSSKPAGAVADNSNNFSIVCADGVAVDLLEIQPEGSKPMTAKQFLNGNINYLGMIPQDMALERAVRQQKIVSLNEPNSDSAKAYEVLTTNLLEGTHHMAPMRRGISQIFSQLLNRR